MKKYPIPQPGKFGSRHGIGLLEVMIAAVVLGFMATALLQMQKNNRETVLRVRARDAASFVAQQVLDSIGATGIHSIVADADGVVMDEEERSYSFEGKVNSNVAYTVKVELLENETKASSDTTAYTRAVNNNADAENAYSKCLKATVSWKFKESTQSIKRTKVVR